MEEARAIRGMWRVPPGFTSNRPAPEPTSEAASLRPLDRERPRFHACASLWEQSVGRGSGARLRVSSWPLCMPLDTAMTSTSFGRSASSWPRSAAGGASQIGQSRRHEGDHRESGPRPLAEPAFRAVEEVERQGGAGCPPAGAWRDRLPPLQRAGARGLLPVRSPVERRGAQSASGDTGRGGPARQEPAHRAAGTGLARHHTDPAESLRQRPIQRRGAG